MRVQDSFCREDCDGRNCLELGLPSGPARSAGDVHELDNAGALGGRNVRARGKIAEFPVVEKETIGQVAFFPPARI